MSQSVFITGATSGIGKQLSLDYAKAGFKVIACGRNEVALKELEKQSSNISPLRFDITSTQDTLNAVSSLPHTPTVWILNAGDCEYIEDGEIDVDVMQRVFNVNVMGLVNCVNAIQERFERGHHLVIIGSIASEVALPRSEAYGASKAAVSYLSRSLAVDLKKKGIQVTTVFPGFVDTPLTQKNTFAMPMIVTSKQASVAIRNGIAKRKSNIYFPFRFTSILRLIGLLPYSWQQGLIARTIK